MRYSVVRLDIYLELIGQERFDQKISEYHCSKDPDVENYLKNTALHHSRHDVSKTFLAVDDDFSILGYYTLAIKCMTVPMPDPGSEVSRTFYRNLNVHEGVVQAYLIGQLSRSDCSFKGLGAELLNLALTNLNGYRANLGCNAVRLDCHDNMIEYYLHKGFKFVKKDLKTGLCQMIAILK